MQAMESLNIYHELIFNHFSKYFITQVASRISKHWRRYEHQSRAVAQNIIEMLIL